MGEMSSVLPAFRPSKSASMQYFRRKPEMSEGCASRLRGRGPLAGSRGRYLSSESGSQKKLWEKAGVWLRLAFFKMAKSIFRRCSSSKKEARQMVSLDPACGAVNE